jgi:hypothetical protein
MGGFLVDVAHYLGDAFQSSGEIARENVINVPDQSFRQFQLRDDAFEEVGPASSDLRGRIDSEPGPC